MTTIPSYLRSVVATQARAWDVADNHIRKYKASLDAALRGEGDANPDVCREQIDRWLEYRHAHGRHELAGRL